MTPGDRFHCSHPVSEGKCRRAEKSERCAEGGKMPGLKTRTVIKALGLNVYVLLINFKVLFLSSTPPVSGEISGCEITCALSNRFHHLLSSISSTC